MINKYKQNKIIKENYKYIMFLFFIMIIIFYMFIIKNIIYNKTFSFNENNKNIEYRIKPNLKRGRYIININYKTQEDSSLSVNLENFNLLNNTLTSDKESILIPLNLNFNISNENLDFLMSENYDDFKIKNIQIKYSGDIFGKILVILIYFFIAFISFYLFKNKNLTSYISLIYIFLIPIFAENIIMNILFLFCSLYVFHLIKTKNILENKDFKIISIFVLISFFIMFFCTKSSPFYIINDWVDSQSYYTMGKGIFNGKVIYRDLFEQKGPVFYFLYGIGYLICKTDFYGVYFLESIFLSMNLYFVYKTAKMFLTKNYALLAAIIFPVFILNFKFMRYGGSCEQFISVFIMISLYLFIKYFKYGNKNIHPPKYMMIHGILGTVVLMSKFNLTLFWAGIGSVIYIDILLKKDYKNFFDNLKYLFFGVLTAAIPVIVYFAANGALKDFFDVIIFNSKYASIGSSEFILSRVLKNFLKASQYNFTCFLLEMLGFSVFIFKKNFLSSLGKAGLVFSYILLVFATYMGQILKYYYFSIAIFCILGIISILYFVEYILKAVIEKEALNYLFIITFILTVYFNGNYQQSILFEKSLTAQEKFAYIMNNESDSPTLLNIDFLDGGFYNEAEIIPNIKFFQRQNISYSVFPENIDTQKNALKNKNVKYAVSRRMKKNEELNWTELKNNYELISTHNQKFEGIDYIYYLYRAK